MHMGRWWGGSSLALPVLVHIPLLEFSSLALPGLVSIYGNLLMLDPRCQQISLIWGHYWMQFFPIGAPFAIPLDWPRIRCFMAPLPPLYPLMPVTILSHPLWASSSRPQSVGLKTSPPPSPWAPPTTLHYIY